MAKPPRSPRPPGRSGPGRPSRPSGPPAERSAAPRGRRAGATPAERGFGQRRETERPEAERPSRPAPPARAQAPRPVARPERTEAPALRRPQEPLLYGAHSVAAALRNPARRVRGFWATEAGAALTEAALRDARRAGLTRPDPEPVDRPLLDRLAPRDAVHQGVLLAVEPLPELGLEDVLTEHAAAERLLVLALDQVTDPHNVGAILRSAAAFGAACVCVTRRHAPEVTGVLAKAASGALELVPIVTVSNLARALAELGEAGLTVVGLDERGTPLGSEGLPARTALVLGAEGEGLRRLSAERCERLLRLPTAAGFASLNVSNAAAIACYAWGRGT